MATEFEQFISEFTKSKTGEKVQIDLVEENIVTIVPSNKKCSSYLGTLWVHVLQHPKNFPVNTTAYKKSYSSKSKHELKLTVSGVTLTIDLVTGSLTVTGHLALDWVINRLPAVIKNYSSTQTRQFSCGSRSDQLTEQEVQDLHAERQNYKRKYINDWPDEAIEATSSDILNTGKLNPYHEPVDPKRFLEGRELETYHPQADLLNKEETQVQLTRLSSGCVVQGCVLYRLWKSALDLWFSDKEAQVFIVAPFIDSVCFTDICHFFLRNSLTANLGIICVPIRSLYGNFVDVKRQSIQRFSAQAQVTLEYKVFSKVVYPLMNVLTSFIAVVKHNKAKILLTNVSFDQNSFHTAAKAIILYQEIEREKFMKEFCNNLY